MRLTVLALFVSLVTACGDQLKAGRCETDSDCAQGLSCSQDLVANVYHRCIQPDAGTGGAGGAAGNDGGGADMTMRECSADRDCPADRPTCGANGMCGACSAGSNGCSTSHPSTPACGPNGACVECAADADCSSAAKPACDPKANTCGPCMSDADCAGRSGPGVCMSHQDGRCASDAETIYVQQTATCATAADPSAGTSNNPFCGADKAAVALSTSRRLIVIRGTVQGASWTLQGSTGDPQVTIIGQQTGTIAGGASPGLQLVGANVFLRDLVVTLSAQIGISASGGSTVRLDHVRIDTNRGGGLLLDSSSFDVKDTTIAGNGPGLLAGDVTWGGIRVQNTPTNAMATFEGITVQGNLGPGILCTTPVTGTSVSAANNSTTDIGPTCGIASCGAPSATCGAM